MVLGLFKSKKQKKEDLKIQKLQKAASNTRMGRGASNTRTKATKALNQKVFKPKLKKIKPKPNQKKIRRD